MADEGLERPGKGQVPERHRATGSGGAPRRRPRPAAATGSPAPRRRGASPTRRRRSRVPTAWRFSLGEALARAFGFFGRHLPVLALFAVVIFLPLALYRLHVAGDVFDNPRNYSFFGPMGFWPDFDDRSGVVARLLEFGLPLFLQATVTLGVFQYLRGGGRVQYGRSFVQGLIRFVPVVGVALMMAFLLFVAAFVTSLLLVAVLSALGPGLFAVVLLGLAVLALMVTILCIFFVAVQAVVVERIGPVKAMARSSWLTSGARWKIFGTLLVLGLLGIVAQWIVRSMVGETPATFSAVRTAILVQTALSAILAVFSAVCAAVIYHDLRKAKEGVGVEELIKVFA